MAGHAPGQAPAGTRQLDEVWEEWSLATQWPLTEDLVLSDRDEDAAEVLRWLRGEPSVLSIQATTTEEAAAFFYATLNTLPDEAAAHYRARCLVATDATAARALANAPPPLILVLTEPNPGLARSLAERGHFVLQTYDDRPVVAWRDPEAGAPVSRRHCQRADRRRYCRGKGARACAR